MTFTISYDFEAEGEDAESVLQVTVILEVEYGADPCCAALSRSEATPYLMGLTLTNI